MRYSYPVTLEREDDGSVTAYFEGLPGATWGANETEALERAKDLLVTALEMLLEDGEPLPTPPDAKGRRLVVADLPLAA